ncbi:BamA/OMP85 family outer membrane protein [Coprobacter fastidiosus]|uniref:Beta-barrel assembly machine subunit BamA n=1 Tax=Coprobacter fastidiosus NSB1 = JCM 33896 TaxID=1349822 RepID=A0A495W9K4_9BACT|nr:Beta-barrel assembly machine subunit BamA [Coprobacter fastidiosus NSB1 = JCM 33896]BEG62568.1 POTRA domain-containing protein [Coprobacter fastidiosus]
MRTILEILQRNMLKHPLLLLVFLLFATGSMFAQDGATVKNDTIYNPEVLYSATPKKYEIAGISVSGVKNNYEDYVLIGFSGLSVGETIEIPGDAITTAVKRFWRQGLFSDVAISVTKIYGSQVWLNIDLKQRPRISQINYNGIKKSEREDLELKLGLVKGNQITPNIVDRAKMLIKKHFEEKGFKNAEVQILQKDDLSHENQVIVDINIDKKEKVKVHKIYIDGNTVLSDNKLQRVMKKTNEKGKLINLFRTKKFVKEKFAEDLNLIIDKYNELGYRDAVIVSDSVAPYNDKTVDVFIKVDEGRKYYLRDIRWVGNTLYPSEYLSALLRMKPGDVYNQKLLRQRTMEDEDAVANLYMNNGYLFFQLDPIEVNVENDSIDLELRMYEGQQARINKIIIQGNDRLYEHVVRRELRTKPGELFNKSDLMRSAREIAQMGHFDPETMDIRPEPDPENGTVDLVYALQSKANDQIEFSAGWGQTGIIGKLSLKFTNFSVKNFLKPKSYKGIIPQGEGQTLTISAQTNARYYQSYSLSFMDPWFGGKRPNSFSFSVYYSRQTDISTSYWNNNYIDPYGYGYNSYYGYNNYYGDNYDYSYAYDPSKSLQMFGVAVGFGKRLNWPDDYFTLSAELGYQLYKLKDWEYLYFMQNGTSHSITLNLTLARNSIDNPIYTRRGSQFSLSLQLTPPYSLFNNVDYSKLDPSNNKKDRETMYKWIEYHKWKFKAKTFTPLTSAESQHTLVLMTRAEVGILGSYNRHKRSPFETFYVGGDGMSGYSYNYATETIALRGYENGSLTPYGYEGYAYTRLGVELHFPVILQPSSTIYALAFAEAGNAWTEVRDFNPFKLKRSAGVGVRIFLPMIGMMGLDWAYGFDKPFTGVQKVGGSQLHFILGQEF